MHTYKKKINKINKQTNELKDVYHQNMKFNLLFQYLSAKKVHSANFFKKKKKKSIQVGINTFVNNGQLQTTSSVKHIDDCEEFCRKWTILKRQ